MSEPSAISRGGEPPSSSWLRASRQPEPPETTLRAAPELVDKVLDALDRGLPASPEELAAALGEPLPQVTSALLEVQRHGARAARERGRRHLPSAWAEAEHPPGARLGGFVLTGVLGRGAMGIVYRAQQLALGNREVALKVLPAGLVARDPRFVGRFRREASLAATIHHPNLAEVYGFEEVGGTWCFAMRLVEGPTLQDVLSTLCEHHRGPVRPTGQPHVRDSALLVRGLADALAAVHAQGLVHRDVKPANVMLEGTSIGVPAADALAAGRPVLVDFGLLRSAGDTDLTGSRTLLGTPAYAAPEALLGRDFDARADVFSLGALCHDLLAITAPGSRPPATAGLADVRSINPAVDVRLAAIVAMALQERKELRYEHGAALRDELDHYLRGEPLRALPETRLGRLRLWARRNPARATRCAFVALLPLALLLGLVAWLVGSSWHLSVAAQTAARCESEGDLLGADDACAELHQAGATARLLFWLAPEFERAAEYHAPGSRLRAALDGLRGAAGPATAPSALLQSQDLQLAVAHQILCELLFGEEAAHLGPRIRAFLLREIGDDIPTARRQQALASWANYLIAWNGPESVDARLTARLRELVDPARSPRPDPATRAAAVRAFGCIRSHATFARLVELVGDEDVEVASAAANCSWHLFRWLHRDDPREFARIDDDLVRRWAIASWNLDLRSPQLQQFPTMAPHLAWWQQPLAGEERAHGALGLPRDIADAVAAAAARLEQAYAAAGRDLAAAPALWVYSGREATDYDTAIFRTGLVDLVERDLWRNPPDAVPRDAHSGGVHFVALPGPAGADEEGAAVGAGTVLRISTRAAVVAPFEGRDYSYLRFDKPGHSMVRVTSVVPKDAVRLRVRIFQMKSARSLLHGEGDVVVRCSLAGLPWETVQSAPGARVAPERRPTDPETNAVVEFDVPPHVFDKESQVDLMLEYLHGNTTFRVIWMELEWTPAQR